MAFGGVVALDKRPSRSADELLVVIGPNGAGDLTMNRLSGFYRRSRVRWIQRRGALRMGVHNIVRAGLARPSGAHIFSNMTVTENVWSVVTSI
jgi:ABC-type branched-subunit amino acid transport system ATPase component